ncbi:keratin-associated protein 5-2-like [Brachypodium distachyon]|uniref:keratin-associated protein 5-2-like n=1 Tax=Brachypodium distachyon TaxID=15368 RepID=UPI000D0DD3AA|nr:keratin-associated protein 5-2-like [Brachypodium distachyon]|eukprot:XP_024310789.1 keratin-associated protein 5-2-like [Brachypodium distachyon]
MASGSAALLKATTLLAVLAMLVLPSSARCQSSRASAPAPAPAPPPPAPAPAPAPVGLRCRDCPAYCAAAVAATASCGKYCDPPPICDSCKSRALQECTACCGTGGGCSSTTGGGGDCGACDYCGSGGCDGHVESRCRQGACYVNDGACKGCIDIEEQHCIDYYCNSHCIQ